MISLFNWIFALNFLIEYLKNVLHLMYLLGQAEIILFSI